MPARVRARGLDSLSIDGRAPSRSVEPTTEAEVAAALQNASQSGESVVPIGGGTLRGVGNAPRRFDVALSTLRLNDVYGYDHRDLTISVGAGLTVAHLAATLAQHKQFIPLDVPRPSRATIGGTL